MSDDKYVKNVADSYEQSGRVDNPGVQAAFDLWQQKHPMQLGDPNFQNDIRELKDQGRDAQIAAAQQENAALRADVSGLQAEAARKAGNADIAKYMGQVTTVGTAAAGALIGSPLLAGSSVIIGDGVEKGSRSLLNDPPSTPEQGTTGMNGQDFEGINNR